MIPPKDDPPKRCARHQLTLIGLGRAPSSHNHPRNEDGDRRRTMGQVGRLGLGPVRVEAVGSPGRRSGSVPTAGVPIPPISRRQAVMEGRVLWRKNQSEPTILFPRDWLGQHNIAGSLPIIAQAHGGVKLRLCAGCAGAFDSALSRVLYS